MENFNASYNYIIHFMVAYFYFIFWYYYDIFF
jgi:hypothetical protein